MCIRDSREMGYTVQRLPTGFAFALVHGIQSVRGMMNGGADPGGDGMALLVEPGDVAQLAGALARVLDRLSDYDPVVLQQRARQTYDHRALADRLFDDYEQILAAH